MSKQRRPRGEGAVFYSESKKCWIWRAVTGHHPDGRFRYTEGRARTKQQAIARKQEAERLRRRPDTERMTTGEFLAYYLEDVAKGSIRENSWRAYEQAVRLHLTPQLGGIPLKALDTAAVNRCWSELGKKGMSAAMVKKVSEVLASALSIAVKEGRIPASPTAKATRPKVPKPAIEIFTDAEVEAILHAVRVRGRLIEVLVVTAIASGARRGEIFALELEDLDLANGVLHIRRALGQERGGRKTHPPKSESGIRSIGLPSFSIDVLRKYVKGRGPGPIFLAPEGGSLYPANIYREWKPMLEAAGLRYRKFHTCRHTHASRLLSAGMNPVEVARRLGDKVETVMDHYAHWIHADDKQTAAKLEEIWGKKGARRRG